MAIDDLTKILHVLQEERKEKKEELKELNITIKSVENTIEYFKTIE